MYIQDLCRELLTAVQQKQVLTTEEFDSLKKMDSELPDEQLKKIDLLHNLAFQLPIIDSGN